MRLIKKLSTGWLLVACVASFNSYAMPSARKADMDAVVKNAAEDAMRQHGIPGLAIAIAAGGEQWFYSYGVASKKTEQKITEDTIFEIGSVSKTFTATLATYAQANGQLSLTDSPGKYLPQLRGTSLDKVTLVNLGTHTAGGFPLQVPDAIGNTGQLMDYFKAWQPAHVAGTERSYANPSIGMLGGIPGGHCDCRGGRAVVLQLRCGFQEDGAKNHRRHDLRNRIGQQDIHSHVGDLCPGQRPAFAH